LQKHSCETHIDHALDMLVAETGNFPIMEMLNEDEKLSTKCSYCEEQATYVVSSN
jgi:CxxH/CxxC protein (TIGR04129 family)